jgi:hypothetical protein
MCSKRTTRLPDHWNAHIRHWFSLRHDPNVRVMLRRSINSAREYKRTVRGVAIALCS